MKIEFVPLLQVQHDLHLLPRGRGRFQEYLRVMLNERRDDVRLPPLVIMNPMGREHVGALLDALAAIDAETIAARAVDEASVKLADAPGEFKLGLVVADDAQGGWTNRYAYEFDLRSAPEATLKRGWLSGVLWSSEAAAASTVREAALSTIYRAAYVAEHGVANTLGEMLRQEGRVLAQAGCTQPALDADDLAYTREVIAGSLEARGRRVAVECLFGDAAARSLGFTPRGLSAWAGLALALSDARLPRLPLSLRGDEITTPRT
ncbi:MAG TPA: hypothetical protein VN699_00540 [Pirellulales bacterium]|nr:hypothetical protein [Pirellulales bacterium]